MYKTGLAEHSMKKWLERGQPNLAEVQNRQDKLESMREKRKDYLRSASEAPIKDTLLLASELRKAVRNGDETLQVVLDDLLKTEWQAEVEQANKDAAASDTVSAGSQNPPDDQMDDAGSAESADSDGADEDDEMADEGASESSGSEDAEMEDAGRAAPFDSGTGDDDDMMDRPFLSEEAIAAMSDQELREYLENTEPAEGENLATMEWPEVTPDRIRGMTNEEVAAYLADAEAGRNGLGGPA